MSLRGRGRKNSGQGWGRGNVGSDARASTRWISSETRTGRGSERHQEVRCNGSTIGEGASEVKRPPTHLKRCRDNCSRRTGGREVETKTTESVQQILSCLLRSRHCRAEETESRWSGEWLMKPTQGARHRTVARASASERGRSPMGRSGKGWGGVGGGGLWSDTSGLKNARTHRQGGGGGDWRRRPRAQAPTRNTETKPQTNKGGARRREKAKGRWR